MSATCLCSGQRVSIVDAPAVSLPAPTVDGNSPAVWIGGKLTVYTSTGNPVAMSGAGILDLQMAASPVVTPAGHFPLWIESVWRDDDGTVYAWYHHEPTGICGDKLTAPAIGALVSADGGQSFQDLGLVLTSGSPADCGAQNGFFAGGNGDFSVVLDRERRFFYFLFTSYGGDASQQGIAMARMAFEDRASPVGTVHKLDAGEWVSPGLGGPVTPVLKASVPWGYSNAESYWGPAVHWNTSLERYVVLLNRTCCKPGWPQEGIYVMFGKDLSDRSTWTEPRKILNDSDIGFAPGYYPQVFGSGVGETDTLAGQLPRLFIKGVSKWQLYFWMEEDQAPVAPPPAEPDQPVIGTVTGEALGTAPLWRALSRSFPGGGPG